jgi:hypothetical protein
MGLAAVCRQSLCVTHVPCADDLECGLGEDCVNKECAFTGCATNSDCATGLCRTDTFACAECGTDDDCPFDKPSCQLPAQKCVQCADDSQCPEPGPAHCDPLVGQCKGCLMDVHCPNGFKCEAGVCTGAKQGQPCSLSIGCSAGLTCVMLGTQNLCLEACNAYQPQCPLGQICYTLKFTGTGSYVFDDGSLLGVCYMPAMNARGYRDSCIMDAMGNSNCQPSLQCVPDSATGSTCRSYCDPGMSNACPSPEVCHPFVGDYTGRDYGLCYADNGYGTRCTADKQCNANEACVPFDDPSSFQGLSPICQFDTGSAPALAPCGDAVLSDGGAVKGNAQCASGACVGDEVPFTQPYFCYGACATDADCSVGGRTGTCDQEYQFTSTSGVIGFITGCRPSCESTAGCNTYGGDAGAFVCRPRLVTGATGGGLKLNCGAPGGSKGPGEPCAFGSECRSGYCNQSDVRGVRRLGYCMEACQQVGDCTDDAGSATGPVGCLPSTFLGYQGPDGIPGTSDDVINVQTVCSGAACVQDDDCSADGGARCAPMVNPADAGLVLRCQPAASPAAVEAGGACNVDNDCFSGACGTLTDGSSSHVCFRACSMGGSPCPGSLSCRAGGFRLSTPTGPVLLDGCAP